MGWREIYRKPWFLPWNIGDPDGFRDSCKFSLQSIGSNQEDGYIWVYRVRWIALYMRMSIPSSQRWTHWPSDFLARFPGPNRWPRFLWHPPSPVAFVVFNAQFVSLLLVPEVFPAQFGISNFGCMEHYLLRIQTHVWLWLFPEMRVCSHKIIIYIIHQTKYPTIIQNSHATYVNSKFHGNMMGLNMVKWNAGKKMTNHNILLVLLGFPISNLHGFPSRRTTLPRHFNFWASSWSCWRCLGIFTPRKPQDSMNNGSMQMEFMMIHGISMNNGSSIGETPYGSYSPSESSSDELVVNFHYSSGELPILWILYDIYGWRWMRYFTSQIMGNSPLEFTRT